MTLDEIVGENIRRLRKRGILRFSDPNDLRRRPMSQELLAQLLSARLRQEYTRQAVSDMESNRRGRLVRWEELVALCGIFKVPLWELVLPAEGVAIDSPDMFDADRKPKATEAVDRRGDGEPTEFHVIEEPPGRDQLSRRLFNLDAKTLTDGKLEKLRQDAQRQRLKQIDKLIEDETARFKDELRSRLLPESRKDDD